MPVHLTRAQYEALAASSAGAATVTPGPAPQPAARRGGVRAPAAVYICRDCGEEIVGESGSLRHLADNHHLRYELVLTFENGTTCPDHAVTAPSASPRP